jgi:hypothetical protein
MLPRMVEDMLKLTIDQIFPKHSLKRKKKPVNNTTGELPSPLKNSKTNKKCPKSTHKRPMSKIEEEEISPRILEELPEEPSEPMDPEEAELER